MKSWAKKIALPLLASGLLLQSTLTLAETPAYSNPF